MYDLIEHVAMNNYTCGGQRMKPKASGVHNVEVISAMEARWTALIEQNIGSLTTGSSSKNTQMVMLYNFCSRGQQNYKCSSIGDPGAS